MDAWGSRGIFPESSFTQELRQVLKEGRNTEGSSVKDGEDTKGNESRLAQSPIREDSSDEDSEGGLAPVDVVPDLATGYSFQSPQEPSSLEKIKKFTISVLQCLEN